MTETLLGVDVIIRTASEPFKHVLTTDGRKNELV